jgi:uncharacterized membrane protein YhhN
MVGTGFFLVSHLLYIIAFGVGERVKGLKRGYKTLRKVTYFIIVIILCLGFYALWDKFPSKIIFVPYGAILAIEVMIALSRY